MGSNRLPGGQGPLFSLAHDMKDGADKHGAAIGLLHHTVLTLGTALATAESAQTIHKNADNAVIMAGFALRQADSNGKGYIATAREALKPRLGKNFSSTWAMVGFKNNSLAVPVAQADRLTLLASMNQYFTANPTMEIKDPNLMVTAAAAQGFWQALSDGRDTVNEAQEDCLAKQTARDGANSALRTEMSGMINELGDLLDDLDPGWLWFGLNQPGAAAGADPVENLSVTAISCGFLAAWPHAVNANLYHLEIQISGVDTAFRRVFTTAQTSASQTGLPPAATVDVRVLSVSDGGTEAAPSNVVRIVTGS